MAGTERFLTFPGAGDEWVVVDRTRNAAAVASCRDANGAALIAALMNGDLGALATASPDALARCRLALGGPLRALTPYGRPSVGETAFPQL